MGFAPVASTAILLVAVFQILGGPLPQMMDANVALDEAKTSAWNRESDYMDMAAEITSASSGASLTQITVTNAGSVTINLLTVALVLDGEPMPADSWSVDGSSTNLWFPGETATLSVASGSYQSIALNLPNGELTFWGS